MIQERNVVSIPLDLDDAKVEQTPFLISGSQLRQVLSSFHDFPSVRVVPPPEADRESDRVTNLVQGGVDSALLAILNGKDKKQ